MKRHMSVLHVVLIIYIYAPTFAVLGLIGVTLTGKLACSWLVAVLLPYLIYGFAGTRLLLRPPGTCS